MRSINQVHRLTDRGRAIEVRGETSDGKTHTTVSIDGVEVSEETGSVLDRHRIELDDERVKVTFGLTGRIKRVELLEQPWRDHGVWFEPPPGTLAHRTWQFREKHPALFAARHFVAKVAGTLLAILAIGALIRAFLSQFVPRIDWSWLPTITLPQAPEWVKYLKPSYWVELPTLPSLPDLPGLPGWLRYVGPILAAAAISAAEYRRHQRRKKREQEIAAGHADS